jgi:hypothetical protein
MNGGKAEGGGGGRIGKRLKPNSWSEMEEAALEHWWR